MTARLRCSLGSARLAAVVVKWLMKRRHPRHLKELGGLRTRSGAYLCGETSVFVTSAV